PPPRPWQAAGRAPLPRPLPPPRAPGPRPGAPQAEALARLTPAPGAPDVPASASTTASPVATDDLLMESYLPWRGDRPGFAAYAEPHDPHGGMRVSSGKARRTPPPWPARRAASPRRAGAGRRGWPGPFSSRAGRPWGRPPR